MPLIDVGRVLLRAYVVHHGQPAQVLRMMPLPTGIGFTFSSELRESLGKSRSAPSIPVLGVLRYPSPAYGYPRELAPSLLINGTDPDSRIAANFRASRLPTLHSPYDVNRNLASSYLGILVPLVERRNLVRPHEHSLESVHHHTDRRSILGLLHGLKVVVCAECPAKGPIGIPELTGHILPPLMPGHEVEGADIELLPELAGQGIDDRLFNKSRGYFSDLWHRVLSTVMITLQRANFVLGYEAGPPSFPGT